MRIRFSSAVTLAVTLLFVSGTVGCQSNGGAWYNPKSYTWSNPFAKKSDAPSYATDANVKPSLDSDPNVDSPHGGYTDGANTYASRAGSQNNAGTTAVPNQGGAYSPASQGTSNPYGGGYSVAETSVYPPPYAGGQTAASGAGTANQYQYTPATAQNQTPNPYAASPTPAGSTQYGTNDYAAGTQYPQTSTQNNPTTAPNYTSSDQYGGVMQPATSVAANPSTTGGNYAPFGPAVQNDPYATQVQPAAPQQPVGTPPATGFYDQGGIQQPTPAASANAYTGAYSGQQPAPTQQYGNEGTPAAAPYQPYPAAQPTNGGYGY